MIEYEEYKLRVVTSEPPLLLSEGAKVFAESRGKSLQTLEVITPEFRFESLYLTDFQRESLQRLWR